MSMFKSNKVGVAEKIPPQVLEEDESESESEMSLNRYNQSIMMAQENPDLVKPKKAKKQKEEYYEPEESDDVPEYKEDSMKNLTIAQQIHQRIFEKFGADIYTQNLNFLKMQNNVNSQHPREKPDDTLVPLSKGTGSFRKSDKSKGIEDLGIAVSTYFKILKMLMYLFSLFTVLCTPLYFIFSCGHVSLQANGWFKEYLTEWTLGNLGESSYQCNMRDVIIYDTNYLKCPAGSKMKALKQFGLQKRGTTPDIYSCPSKFQDYDKQIGVVNEVIDQDCSLDGLKDNYPDQYDNFVYQYQSQCQDQETCSVYIQNDNWPEVCSDKIGKRLNIVASNTKPEKQKPENYVENSLENELLDGRGSGGETVTIDVEVEVDTDGDGIADDTQTEEREFTMGFGTTGGDRRLLEEDDDSGSSMNQYKDAYNHVTQQNQKEFFMIAIIECGNEDIQLRWPLEDWSLNRNDVGIVSVTIDLLIMTIFGYSLLYIGTGVKRDTQNYRKQVYETKQFSVVVYNLPKVSISYSIEQMKSDLWTHLEAISRRQPNQIQDLNGFSNERNSEIVDIHFTRSDYQHLDYISQIQNLNQELKIVLLQQEFTENQSEYGFEDNEKALAKKKLKIYDDTQKLINKYHESMKKIGMKSQAVSAIVLFRSMEGAERTLYAFNQKENSANYWFYRVEKDKSLEFRHRTLKVGAAINPDLINWKNIGLPKFFRYFRYSFFSICILACGYAYIQLLLSLQNKKIAAQQYIPDIKCQDDVDANTANIDFFADPTQRTGDFHCFCKNLYNDDQVDLKFFQFPLDKETHCKEWYEKYLEMESAIGGISGLIISATLLVELFVYNASKLTRAVDEQHIINSSIKPLTWILFLNVGVSIFMVDLSSQIGSYSVFKGLQYGWKDTISSRWYLDVGTQIIFSMMCKIISPHVVPIVLYSYHQFIRFKDRGFTSDLNKSKQLIQIEYEKMYIGPQFKLETRLSHIIELVWVTFMYSSGLPSLIFLTTINFTIIYWLDKWLLLRFYAKSKNYNEKFSKCVMTELKWTFLFHFFFGRLTYANSDILNQSGSSSNDEGETTLISQIFLYGNLAILMMYLIRMILKNKILRKSNLYTEIASYLIKYKQYNQSSAAEDYYDVMNVDSLILEYNRTLLEKRSFSDLLNEYQDEKSAFLSYERHFNRLEEKEDLVRRKIDKLCLRHNIEGESFGHKIYHLQECKDANSDRGGKIIKSKIQSYDIRDSPKYRGIINIESIVRKFGNVSWLKARSSTSKIVSQLADEYKKVDEQLHQSDDEEDINDETGINFKREQSRDDKAIVQEKGRQSFLNSDDSTNKINELISKN